MKTSLLTFWLLVCTIGSYAQLSYYASARYDYSAGSQPTIEIGKGDIVQRAALVVSNSKENGINLLSVGVSGYTQLFCLWDVIHTSLYLNGSMYMKKDMYLVLKSGLAVNIPIHKSMSIQFTQGICTYDNDAGGLMVSSLALNYYFK